MSINSCRVPSLASGRAGLTLINVSEIPFQILAYALEI